jgi:alcohol dehydrogenase class IV
MQPGSHEFLAQDRVVWGRPAAQAALEEADRRGARRVFVVTSRTLNRRTGAVAAIVDALGARHVGTFDECVEHTPRPSVIAAAEAARAASPDLVLTVGGGTAIDTVKVMLIALAHDVRTPEGLSDWHLKANPDGTRHAPAVAPPPFRQVVVSTTLGAAEFSDFGGCTDPVRRVKDGYAGKYIGAAAVILDPAITVHTPEWLWLSTAVRGIDHAVEGLCSSRRRRWSTRPRCRRCTCSPGRCPRRRPIRPTWTRGFAASRRPGWRASASCGCRTARATASATRWARSPASATATPAASCCRT